MTTPDAAAIDTAEARADKALDAYETKRDAIMQKLRDLAEKAAQDEHALIEEWLTLAKKTDDELVVAARVFLNTPDASVDDLDMDPRLGETSGGLVEALGDELECGTILIGLLNAELDGDAFPDDGLESSSDAIAEMAAEARGEDEDEDEDAEEEP